MFCHPQLDESCALDPEAQGDSGAMVVTAPGWILTLQPSSYTTVALPPGPAMMEFIDIGAGAAGERFEALAVIDGEVARVRAR